MKNVLAATSVLVMTILSQGSPAQASYCWVGFDDNLHLFGDQGRTMFVVPTTFVEPNLQYCPPPWPLTDTGKCWMYRQYCNGGGSKFVSVFNMYGPDYALDFEDPSIDCVIDGTYGTWGRRP